MNWTAWTGMLVGHDCAGVYASISRSQLLLADFCEVYLPFRYSSYTPKLQITYHRAIILFLLGFPGFSDPYMQLGVKIFDTGIAGQHPPCRGNKNTLPQRFFSCRVRLTFTLKLVQKTVSASNGNWPSWPVLPSC